MTLVCLDTHILIWGIKGESTPGQEPMIDKAKNFLHWLDETKTKVMIPTIVISELLLPVPLAEHSAFLQVMQGKFIVAPFDILGAQALARVWQDKKGDGTIEQLKLDPRLTRAQMRADCQIVATALVNRADCIYTYDVNIDKFACGLIRTEKMPEIGVQSQIELPEA